MARAGSPRSRRTARERYTRHPVKTLLIVYHSLTGGTRQMAEAAARGARSEPEIATRLLTAAEADGGDLLAADGYIFAAPENLAALVGRMKDFFDRAYYVALDRINGRPYAALICAGSDGQNAARQIARITTGWRLRLDRRPSDRMHARADPGGDPGAEADSRCRTQPMRGTRCSLRRRPGRRHLLISGAPAAQ